MLKLNWLYIKAVQVLDEALKLDPKCAEAYFWKGDYLIIFFRSKLTSLKPFR